MWNAIGAHPQGAKMPGYGSWGAPTDGSRGAAMTMPQGSYDAVIIGADRSA